MEGCNTADVAVTVENAGNEFSSRVEITLSMAGEEGGDSVSLADEGSVAGQMEVGDVLDVGAD